MLRKYLLIGVLLAQVIVILVMVAVFLQQPSTASASIASVPDLAPPNAPEAQGTNPTGVYMWSFAAKFVCGYQPQLSGSGAGIGEPVVAPGNYATEVNIHNPNYKSNVLRKRYIVLVNDGQQLIAREPQSVASTFFMSMTLGVDSATMDDCNGLWQNIYPAAGVPVTMPLTIGYLVVLSPLDLDVDVVYTSNAPGAAQTAPTGISSDVVRVSGKRVFIPPGALFP